MSKPNSLEVADARLVESRVCRVRYRCTTFAHDRGEKEIADLAGKMGRLTAHLHSVVNDVLSSGGESTIQSKAAAALFDLKESPWSKFTGGNPARKRDTVWSTIAYRAIALFVAGTEKRDKADPEVWKVVERIREYFFGRDWKAGDRPRYFNPPRDRWPAPWSPHELADEIGALTGMRLGDPKTECRLTVLACDTMLLAQRPADDVGTPGYVREALSEAAEAGVQLRFLVAPRSRARSDVDEFLSELDEKADFTEDSQSRRPEIVQLLPDDPYQSPINELFWLQSSGGKDGEESTLYVARPKLIGSASERPIAYDASSRERDAFAEFVKAILERKPSTSIDRAEDLDDEQHRRSDNAS